MAEDRDVLHLAPGALLAIDFFRHEIRVCPSGDFAAEAVHALPHAQQAARDFNAEAAQLREALCELHRAVTEHDGSDADHARIDDAIKEAQRLAPYEPEPPAERIEDAF